MAKTEHTERLWHGVDGWNLWRSENPRIKPDISHLHFSRIDLQGFNLSGADLNASDLTKAILKRADLTGATLVETVLVDADLTDATAHEANLDRADLRQAHLHGTNFTAANLCQANFAGATLWGTIFHRARLQKADFSYAWVSDVLFTATDLRTVIGLNSIAHRGSSSIDTDTFFRSHSEMPEAFLRGVGLPDSLITYAKSLTGRAIEFYSCFISYSTQDQPFADRLHADLQAHGVRCWFAPHDAQLGKKLYEQIDEAIRRYDKLLLILSPFSMSSEWVKTEIAGARQREVREHTQMLFPISIVPFSELKSWRCFDADTGKDSAREIREYLVADFSDWKNHDAYTREFQKLVKDLKVLPAGGAGDVCA